MILLVGREGGGVEAVGRGERGRLALGDPPSKHVRSRSAAMWKTSWTSLRAVPYLCPLCSPPPSPPSVLLSLLTAPFPSLPPLHLAYLSLTPSSLPATPPPSSPPPLLHLSDLPYCNFSVFYVLRSPKVPSIVSLLQRQFFFWVCLRFGSLRVINWE